MKYDNLTIQKLRELSILEVAEKLGFKLKGLGDEGRRAICPYHDDKHPSLHFSKKKGIFKCFVCGAKGDLFKLVMDDRNCSFLEACDWLVNEFHVVVVENMQPMAGNSSKSNSKLKNPETNSEQFPSKAGSQITSSLSPLPLDIVIRSLSLESQFCKAVVSARYLSQGQLQNAAARYRLGASKEGGVIFWEIDDQQRVHTGKIMYYQPDCHRDKEHNPTWVHSLMKEKLPQNYELQHCLFGLHLLTMEQPTAGNSSKSNSKLNNSETNFGQFPCEAGKKIAIVESEKSAVIMSEVFKDFIWMSCGGLQMFKPELLAPLVNHKVVIFPDTDETGEAYKAWLTVLQQAQRQYTFRYPLRISRLLEDKATQEQKQRKIDLVDFIFSAQTP